MNPVLAGIAPSIIRAINARKRPGDVDLGLGEPTLRPDPRPFEAAAAWVREHGCPYTANAGFARLREQIAAYAGLPERGAAENAVVTVGSEEALYLGIKALLDPARDEALVVEPCYLAYPKLCALEGVRHRMVAMDAADGFRPSAARVLEALRPETRLVILNSPNNPTGRTWPEAELRALAEGLAARPGEPVWVLSDEVYRELYFTGTPPVSIGALWPHALVAGSLSKSNALTGLRLGWLVGDAEVIAAAIKAHQLVNTAASTFSQVVAMEVFRDPATLSAHRPHYTERRALLAGLMELHGLEWLPPEGAFYCMVRLPERWAADSLGAAEALLERHRVLATPGVAFGDSGEGWLRLSWVAEPDALRAGIERIAEFFAHSLPRDSD
ncbi:MAG TPA: pyridoxal phosphate-dependent aminotransferase [Longimicrobium sp.]|nr:pyridoxal phosphate-dependent aminotransferase [Longimicrobium sp.]